MSWFNWSQTASSNAGADPTINWAEGQAPSSINDSARAMMAATAKYRDDIAGAIVTGGSSTAYTVASYSSFDTLAHLNGQMIAFSPHTTNGATVLLNVDGLGQKPLRSAPNVELLAGTIIQGTPYVAVYNNTDGAFYLQGLFGNPYNIPLLGGMDFWDTVAPNSSFIFPQGQAISRTTYAAAFARWGTTFGVGDGSTTFNVPNKTGKVSAMIEISHINLTPTYFGGDSTVLGAVGGLENATAPLPAHSHGVTDPGHSHSVSEPGAVTPNTANTNLIVGTNALGNQFVFGTQAATTGISINSAGSGTGVHNNVQPTIICNYIIRVI